MRCTNCGKDIENSEANFCPVCGTKVAREPGISSGEVILMPGSRGTVSKKKNIPMIIAVCFVIVIALVIVNKSVNRKPTTSMIKSDLSAQAHLDEFLNDEGYFFRIADVDIDKYKIEDDTATCWCTVKLKNDIYDVEASVEVEYEYYEKAGWEFKEASHYSDETYEAKTGYPEDIAVSNLYSEYGSLSVLEHETDLDSGRDVISFSYEKEGTMYDEIGSLTVYYMFKEDYGWITDEIIEEDVSRDIHPSGVWIVSDLNWCMAVSFESFGENTVYTAEYWFDTLHNDYSINYKFYPITFDDNGNVIFGDYEEYTLTKEDVLFNGEKMSENESILDRCDRYKFVYSLYEKGYKEYGSDAVEVPDVVGLSYSEAAAKLENLGFVVERYINQGNKVYGIFPPDTSTSLTQSLPEGTKMGNGSTVVLRCIP